MQSVKIKEASATLGFDACGIAPAAALEKEKELLRGWISKGMNGKMDWMSRNLEKRCDPRLVMEGTRSVIVVLLNYYPEKIQQVPGAPVYGKYAYGKDYHKVIKKKLKQLEDYIHQMEPGAVTRAFVDSSPLLEKVWARRAGLGWTGKHSILIARNGGSFNFIGAILTNLELQYDDPFSENLCGSCTLCMDACPTGALISEGVLDARRCIAYQTIEYEEVPTIGLHGRIMGCDICQDACPWNQKAVPHHTPEFRPDERLLQMNREQWLNLNEKEFKEILGATPAKRVGYERIMRNIRYALDIAGKEKKKAEHCSAR